MYIIIYCILRIQQVMGWEIHNHQILGCISLWKINTSVRFRWYQYWGTGYRAILASIG